jgi:hypothetical protein
MPLGISAMMAEASWYACERIFLFVFCFSQELFETGGFFFRVCFYLVQNRSVSAHTGTVFRSGHGLSNSTFAVEHLFASRIKSSDRPYLSASQGHALTRLPILSR